MCFVSIHLKMFSPHHTVLLEVSSRHLVLTKVISPCVLHPRCTSGGVCVCVCVLSVWYIIHPTCIILGQFAYNSNVLKLLVS